MPNIEIERKFLLRACNIEKFLKKRKIQYSVKNIEQFYLLISKKESIRCRKIGKRFIKTIKRGKDLAKEEIEKEITKKSYKKCKEKRVGKILKKKRLEFKVGGYLYQIDIFKGKLKNLRILEVEFSSIKKAQEFEVNNFLNNLIIEEITQKIEFSNSFLSKKLKFPAIKDKSKFLDYIENFSNRFNFEIKYYDSIDLILRAKLINLAFVIMENYKKFDKESIHKIRVSSRRILTYYKNLNPKIKVDIFKNILKKSSKVRELQLLKDELNRKKWQGSDSILYNIDQKIELFMKEYKNYIESLNFKEELLDFYTKLLTQSIIKNEALINIAKYSLYRASKNIDKKIKNLKIDDKEKSFHKLRIKIKEVRYLIELFFNIFDTKKAQELIEEIKELQDRFGRLQDINSWEKLSKDNIIEAEVLKELDILNYKESFKKEIFDIIKDIKFKSKIKKALCSF